MRRGRVVAAAGTVLGLGFAAAGLWLALRDPSPDRRVADCRNDHGVSSSAPTLSEESSDERENRRWADCTWPRPRGADEDGFWKVTVGWRQWGEAPATVNVYAFTTTCEDLAMRYNHAASGSRTTWRYDEVPNGQILWMGGFSGHRKPRLMARSLPFELEDWVTKQHPEADLTIVTDVNTTLTNVGCAPS